MFLTCFLEPSLRPWVASCFSLFLKNLFWALGSKVLFPLPLPSLTCTLQLPGHNEGPTLWRACQSIQRQGPRPQLMPTIGGTAHLQGAVSATLKSSVNREKTGLIGLPAATDAMILLKPMGGREAGSVLRWLSCSACPQTTCLCLQPLTLFRGTLCSCLM